MKEQIILKHPKDRYWNGLVKTIKHGKDQYRQEQPYTKFYESVFTRTGRTESGATVFEFSHIEMINRHQSSGRKRARVYRVNSLIQNI